MNPHENPQLLEELRRFQRELCEPAIAETIRLIESPQFPHLEARHVREVSEYRPSEIAGERFYERAWTRSKEVGAMLGLALLLGRDLVLSDLSNLRSAAQGTR